MSEILSFADIPDPKKNRTIKDVIRLLMSEKQVSDEVMPFFSNGTVFGSEALDVDGALRIVEKHDSRGLLAPFGLNRHEKGLQLKGVMREKFDFNKRGKIQDYSKRVRDLLPPGSS